MHSSAGDLAALLDADLIHNGWDGAVSPYPGMTARQLAMQNLRKSLLKKFHNEKKLPDCDRKALALFQKINEQCRVYKPDLTTVDELLWTAIGEAKSFIDRFCHPEGLPLCGFGQLEPHMGFGRGANMGAKTGDPYGKLAISTLTYTNPALLVLFQASCNQSEVWRGQEQFRSKHYKTKQVQGSKLSFVPKSNEISRTICTEPILNMFFQKGIAHVLEKRLRGVVGIDLSTQPEKNRELCRLGSETGKFGTIDLSSASDSMSLSLVRDWFPDHLVRWLELTRSKSTTLEDGTEMELHMVSSMGNAFTFPLQTIFFTALVVGAYRALDQKIQFPHGATLGNFAVFGDDIIVTTKCYNLVVRMLTYAGFSVNYDKSFNTGLFRESCGRDYYCGYNVRGVYVRKLLDDQDCYSAFNRLALWSSFHGISLDRCLEYLWKGVSKVLVVPLHEDDEAGFKVPEWFARGKLSRNRHLQSYNYVAAVRKPLSVSLPELCEVGQEVEVYDRMRNGKLKRRRRHDSRRLERLVPGWRYNPDGILLLLLHGNIRDGQLGLRSETKKTEYRKRSSSSWNYLANDGSERTVSVHEISSALAVLLHG